jgi:hypothetical protein
MSLGFKRTRSIVEQSHRSKPYGRTDDDSLFEKEWDELVIRFDAESHQYKVGTSSQDVEPDDGPLTAKSNR